MQTPTPFTPRVININFFSISNTSTGIVSAVMASKRPLLSEVVDVSSFASVSIKFEDHERHHASLVKYQSNATSSTFQHPHAAYYYPVFESEHDINSRIVAFLVGLLPFDRYLINLLPEGVRGIDAVLRSRGEAFTYRLDGNSVRWFALVSQCFQRRAVVSLRSLLLQAFYVGPVDMHEASHDSTKRTVPFYSYTDERINENPTHFAYEFDIYATSQFEASYKTWTPWIAAVSVILTFSAVLVSILAYDCFVRRQDEKVRGAAAVSGGIVSSLFPSHVRRQIFESIETTGTGSREFRSGQTATCRTQKSSKEGAPIACLFPETTVLFCDIAGFTHWSSARAPEQVFTLLETIFRAFDAIARRLRVYKVETIGDCYVAVTGLPDPQPRHASIMAQFARECLGRMRHLLFKLQRHLGPGTEVLGTRFGLHSGPVTAGVLRGERARFQLFGDTVHIASRMESTCLCDHIQVSQDTAAELQANGNASWLTLRDDATKPQGMGTRQTFWVSPIDPSETETLEFC
jgi:class 3 adenylate cyclase